MSGQLPCFSIVTCKKPGRAIWWYDTFQECNCQKWRALVMSQKFCMYTWIFFILHLLCKILTTFLPLLKNILQRSYFPVLLLSKPAVYIYGWMVPSMYYSVFRYMVCLRMIPLNRWSYHTLTPGIWRPPGIVSSRIITFLQPLSNIYVHTPLPAMDSSKGVLVSGFLPRYTPPFYLSVCCR